MKKKYLMQGAAAMFVSVSFFACSSDKDLYDPQSEVQNIVSQYQQAFVKTYGQPAANQTWGFSDEVAGSRMTRSAMPETPTFRDDSPIVKPTVPSAYQNTIPENAHYAKDYQNYQKGDIIYINSEFSTLNNPQNTEDLTIYVDGNVTYWGQTNQNGNGATFCVTQGSTLKLGAVSNNLTVYLAPNATLDVTEALKWDGTPDVDWQGIPNTSLTFQNAHAAIYLSAGSTVKGGNLTFINGCQVLNAGGTIETTNLTVDQNSTLWNEGTVKVSNKLISTNMNAYVYNAQGKTIEAAEFDLINNNNLLYNDGTVTATGAVTTHNSDAEVVNNGTLTCASYSQAAGGKMHNVGTVTMTGKTDLTNSNSKWQNDGQWTCGSFDVDNYSYINFNNCKLTVNGNYHLNRGTFVLNSDASVVCRSFTWEDTSDFYLGSRSMVKCSGNILTQNQNSNYGFRGYGDDYAVIEANAIIHEGNEQFRMSYYGKLYIATDNHFALWYKDAPNINQPSYWYEPTVKFKFNNDASPVKIEENECNPGYDGGDVIPEDNVKTIRIMAEDLSASEASDFDFNDVVFDVEADFSSAQTVNQVKITLWAAGGTLPLKINSADGVGGFEVHSALGVEDVLTMTNTHAMPIARNPYKGDDNVAKYTETVTLANGGTIRKDHFKADVNNYLRVEVQKEINGNQMWCLLEAKQGVPACKLGVPVGTPWVMERHNIANAFTNFQDWVDTAEPEKWYTVKVADHLYNDGKSVSCAHGCTD
jgi:hypothetical protein